jgi:lipopolysaccharide/colanic/teichoic acid biosynthesis glycosyltransferase
MEANVNPAPLGAYARYGKRILDGVVGLILALLTLPIVLVLLAMAWIAFGWAPLVRERRIGRNGKPFNLYRINTRKHHRADLRGRRLWLSLWLRRTSLDELPQLWNVTFGRMSLVGPRPLPPVESDKLDAAAPRRRHTTRPGLTGPWQVLARGDGRDLFDHFDIDLAYVERITFRRDLAILAHTLPTVFRHHEDV